MRNSVFVVMCCVLFVFVELFVVGVVFRCLLFVVRVCGLSRVVVFVCGGCLLLLRFVVPRYVAVLVCCCALCGVAGCCVLFVVVCCPRWLCRVLIVVRCVLVVVRWCGLFLVVVCR